MFFLLLVTGGKGPGAAAACSRRAQPLLPAAATVAAVDWPPEGVNAFLMGWDVRARRIKDPVLESMGGQLRDALHPDFIYLFGSRARENAREDSDYDFFVVVPTSDKPRCERDREAYPAICGNGVGKDVIVLTRAEFEASRRTAASLTSTVVSEGILLHEAGNQG